MSAQLPSIDLDLPTKLGSDKEYRQAFFLAESSALIAKQLIEIRKRRKLNQKQVAEALGTGQPAISRIERADYRNWSFNTLQRVASALDARLRVIITPSEDVINEYRNEQNVREKSLEPPNLVELFRIFSSSKIVPAARNSISDDGFASAITSLPVKQVVRSSILDVPAIIERQQLPNVNEPIGATCN
jgi:transcriptional regulator with XRE-family HTH domain